MVDRRGTLISLKEPLAVLIRVTELVRDWRPLLKEFVRDMEPLLGVLLNEFPLDSCGVPDPWDNLRKYAELRFKSKGVKGDDPTHDDIGRSLDNFAVMPNEVSSLRTPSGPI